MPKHGTGPQRRTNPLIWCAAIVIGIVSLAVIIVGLIVIITYLIVRPKTPSISISYANLDKIYYDQSGNFASQVTLVIKAQNDNAKVHANFYNVGLVLGFRGLEIAKLVNKAFDVKKNSSVEFTYVVEPRQIILGRMQEDYLQSLFRKGMIEFELKGKARTRWKVWAVGWVKFSLHLDCELGFFVPNGSFIMGSHCSSKSS